MNIGVKEVKGQRSRSD